MPAEIRRVRTGEVELSVTVAGSGPPLLLLHGFPDSAAVWRHQIPALAEAGYTVIAPDLRGFGRSDAPEGAAAYRMERILADVQGLLRALAIGEPVRLVGHDWGAAVGWLFCMRHADRVARFAALSVGHPAAYRSAGWRQKVRGWYTLAFQVPGLAERMVAADRYRFLRRVQPTAEDGERWVAELARPGRLTAGLNWYRANLRLFLSTPFPEVRVPVLGVFSTGDVALVEEQMASSARFVRAEWRYARMAGVGHWLQIERPDETTALLLDWFGRPGGG